MIVVFRKHAYDLDSFERYGKHGFSASAGGGERRDPACLVEWVAERVARRRLVDVVPPGTDSADYPHPALVLEGGMVLPVVKALDGTVEMTDERHVPILAGLNLDVLIWALPIGQHPL